MEIPDVVLASVAICCDLECHVFYAAHTDPQVAEALVRRLVSVGGVVVQLDRAPRSVSPRATSAAHHARRRARCRRRAGSWLRVSVASRCRDAASGRRSAVRAIPRERERILLPSES